MHPIRTLPAVLTIAGVAWLVAWLGTSSDLDLTARVPGRDGRPDPSTVPQAPVVAAELRRFDGAPADIPGSWSGFRGDALTGKAEGESGLARAWAEGGPPALWRVELGEGYAGPAVRDGRVFVLDYDREIQSDALRCLSLADGKEIWRYSYPVAIKRNHGMSRTVPAVTDRYVVALGPKCHVTCCLAETGERLWQLDLVRDFQATVPPWYAGQCPLIEGDRVILAPGGAALVMAVSLEKGEVLWSSPNPKAWKMTHASILPLELGGRRMYVTCGSGGVAGVSAEDGSLLWETEEWKIGIATVPSPVDLGGGRVFLSGGYNAGSLFLRLREEGGRIVPEVEERLDPDVFGSTQQTPILHQGHIYGVRPDGELVCLDLEGTVVWSSGSSKRFGIGPYLLADGLLYVVNDSGTMTLAEATPAGYRELASAKVLEGPEAWGPMALVAGRLLARDFRSMVCLDVKAK